MFYVEGTWSWLKGTCVRGGDDGRGLWGEGFWRCRECCQVRKELGELKEWRQNGAGCIAGHLPRLHVTLEGRLISPYTGEGQFSLKWLASDATIISFCLFCYEELICVWRSVRGPSWFSFSTMTDFVNKMPCLPPSSQNVTCRHLLKFLFNLVHTLNGVIFLPSLISCVKGLNFVGRKVSALSTWLWI